MLKHGAHIRLTHTGVFAERHVDQQNFLRSAAEKHTDLGVKFHAASLLSQQPQLPLGKAAAHKYSIYGYLARTFFTLA